MPAYDASRYDPPAPTAQVVLRNGETGAMVPDVILLMDTGADVTLLPRFAVEKLGLRPHSGALEYELIGFDGSCCKLPAVELDMIFLQRAFRGRYLVTDGDRGILGRDVLSSVRLLLDGPRREWFVIDDEC
jgi:hypothetical protein